MSKVLEKYEEWKNGHLTLVDLVSTFVDILKITQEGCPDVIEVVQMTNSLKELQDLFDCNNDDVLIQAQRNIKGQYINQGKESQVVRLSKQVAEFGREKIEELFNILIDNKLEIDDAIHVLLRSPEILFPNNFQDEQTVIADYKICFQYSEGVDYLDIDSLKFQQDEIADLLIFLDRKLRDVREFHVQKKQLEEWKKE